MSTSFTQSNPAAAAATLQAYFDAVAWWKSHPEEGNAIIARRLNFPLQDVVAVIGDNGAAKDGGIRVFDLDEAARFMKVKAGPVPVGGDNGINDHWQLTSEWWVKFGLIPEVLPAAAGIDLTPLQSIVQP